MTITFWHDRLGPAGRQGLQAGRRRPTGTGPPAAACPGSPARSWCAAHRGQNTLRFGGKVAGRKLAAGRYRVQLAAVDPAGNPALLKRFAIRVKA